MQRLLALKNFYAFAKALSPWLLLTWVALLAYGVIGGLVWAPADYQQGEAFRIIYVHVPSAFLSLGIYTAMAMMAAIHLIWRVKLATIWIAASVPIGASFTFLALLTGALWGKPMWGTWWVWDARLTSELVLLFLYLGYIALHRAMPRPDMAERAGSLLILIGVVNVPIVHFSVTWWYTLHQGPTLSRFAKPAMAPEMLMPLLAMIAAFGVFYVWLALLCARNACLARESTSTWVQEEVINNA